MGGTNVFQMCGGVVWLCDRNVICAASVGAVVGTRVGSPCRFWVLFTLGTAARGGLSRGGAGGSGR